jgi:hypothetical protein
MSSRSEQERERLKEEYKDHYRKMRDLKEKVRRSQSVRNISEAVENLNTDDLMESVDQFIDKIRHKVASVEARLDVALENLSGDLKKNPDMEEFDDEIRKQRAQETIKQVKLEMGLLYHELEKRAGDLKVEKTVGTKQEQDSAQPENEKPDINEESAR